MMHSEPLASPGDGPVPRACRRVAVLGSTGSLGRQALELCRAFADRVEVVALAASGRRARELAEQARAFRPRLVACSQPEQAPWLRDALAGPGGPAVVSGPDALVQAACHPDVDLVLVLTQGLAGLDATLEALRSGRRVALANKEVLVAAGELLDAAAHLREGRLLPVDSEHSALWQSLWGEQLRWVRRLWLTASGGPFWGWPVERLATVTPRQALAHPTWQMGPRITVDSATLMNKGFEVIEAHRLFGVPCRDIHVLIHRQSVIHSVVELADGSFKAQFSLPDMRLPLLLAISFPERWPFPPAGGFFDPPARVVELTLEHPASEPRSVRLARQALEAGSTYPAVLVAADEAAVEAFLQGLLPFPRILDLVDHALQLHVPSRGPLTRQAIAAAEQWVCQHAGAWVRQAANGKL